MVDVVGGGLLMFRAWRRFLDAKKEGGRSRRIAVVDGIAGQAGYAYNTDAKDMEYTQPNNFETSLTHF